MVDSIARPNIDAVERIELQTNSDGRGTLVVGEADRHVRFPIKRFFAVSGVPAGETRGRHAHKSLHQMLICLNGTVRVDYDDGESTAVAVLDRPDVGLLIPPGIWAEQSYANTNTVLLVLCDAPFDEADYLRDYDEFMAYRRGLK